MCVTFRAAAAVRRLLGFAAALALVASASVGAARAYPLVAHWAGEGNAQDTAGGSHGTAFGGAAYAPGVSGQAFRFDGVDDGVAVPDAESLKLTGSLTIEVWVKILGLPSPEQVWGMILFRGDNREGFDPYFLGVDAQGRLAFNVQGADNVPYTIYTPAPVETGRFVHVVATLDDASGRMSLFLDDVLVAHAMTVVRPLRDLDPGAAPGVAIGNHSGHPGAAAYNFAFNGLVDELKLYNTARRVSAAPWAAVDMAVGADNDTRLLWNRSDGAAGLWNVAPGGAIRDYATFAPVPGWVPRALAVGPDNRSRLLWNRDDGAAGLWLLSPSHAPQGYHTYGPYPGWSATDVAVDAQGRARLLWNQAGGRAGLWAVNAGGGIEGSATFGPYAGWTAVALAVGVGDNRTRLLWRHADGRAWLWVLSPSHALEASFLYGPFPGWKALDVAAAARDNKTRLLWHGEDGAAGLWTVGASGAIESFATHGPFAEWTGRALAVDNSNKTRLLWYDTAGRAGLWTLLPVHAPEAYLSYGPF